MNPSIRRRLLISLLSAILSAWALMAISSYLDIRYEVEELQDAQLAQSARVLLAFNTTNLEEQSANAPQSNDLPDAGQRLFGHKYENKLAFQIWSRPGKLVLKSANAPPFPLSEHEYGYENKDIFGRRWRVFSLPDDNSPMIIKVGERDDIRQDLIHSVALRTLIPVVIALPLLALLIWFGIGRGMAPLEKVARQVEHRAPNYLQPVESSGVPIEAKPLVDSLNNLFERLAMAFESERRFTADAAHELRTPLAGLKAQAYVALKSNSELSRQKALNLVVEGVDRSTHLVQQLLTLARIDPEAGLTEYENVDLCIIANSVINDLTPQAQDKNIALNGSKEGQALVRGNKGALSILVRNLVDNAIRYTPPGGKVDINIERDEKNILLHVADSGPGIPEDEREQVFKRFYRRLGTQAPGSGLGLSIVSRVAELHHATLTLEESTYKGLQVNIDFSAVETNMEREAERT